MAKKKSRKAELLVVAENGAPDGLRALSLRDRTLSFGEKWSYAPAPEASSYIQLKKCYQHFINGKPTADVTDETTVGAKEGLLALQIHVGPPMVVQFKDFVLKQLK